MENTHKPSGTIVFGLPAAAVRVAGGVLVAGAVVFLILGLTSPSSRQETVQRPVDGASAGPAIQAASGRPVVDFYTRKHIISGAYKVYGLKEGLWLAKTIFRNDTSEPMEDLRIRYRTGEFADWASWHVHPRLVPTQTVVDLYHPYLSSRIAALSSRTPAEVQMEYEYRDSAGKLHTGQMSSPVALLGRGDFVFSDLTREEMSGSFQDIVTNSALLAAYVTSQDGPVAQLASEANKIAGGVGASQDDESCIKVMAELYEIMRTIGITYQHPSTTFERGKDSFDLTLVQRLQYPRETIQKRSGTCIDLAILYAAMMHSVNIRPVLVILDGHCFPMGITPNGTPVPVEATFVGGGGAQSGSFKQAVDYGIKEWRELQKSGRFVRIDLQEAWTAGISPPELDPLDADILNKWKVIDAIQAARNRTNNQPEDTTTEPPAATLAAGNYAIVLTNQATQQQSTGQAQVKVQGAQFELIYQFDYQVAGQDGRPHQAREVGRFVGAIRGRSVAARSREVVWTLDGQRVQPQGLPYDLTIEIGQDGKSAAGNVAMSNGVRLGWQMQLRGGN